MLQLNPSKLEKNEDVNLNQAHLLSILSELVERIFSAADILPRSVSILFWPAPHVTSGNGDFCLDVNNAFMYIFMYIFFPVAFFVTL